MASEQLHKHKKYLSVTEPGGEESECGRRSAVLDVVAGEVWDV